MIYKMMKTNNVHLQIQIFYVLLVAVSLLVTKSFTSSVPTLTDNNDGKVCTSPQCRAAAINLQESISSATDPCDNFYQYACGNWPKVHKTKTTLLPTSTIQIRSDVNDKELLDFLKQPNNKTEPEAVHKARKLFSLCVDEKAYPKNGIEQITNILSKIGLTAVPPYGKIRIFKPKYDYIKGTIKALKFAGVKQFFDIGVEPNPFNQTVNVIGLTKPAMSMDPGALPLYKNVFSNKASESVSQNDYVKKVMIKMCGKSNAAVCWLLNYSLFAHFQQNLFSGLLKYEQERVEIIAKARPKMNSSAAYNLYSLQELQIMTDKIAEDIVTNVPQFNWTKCIELLFSDVENVTIDLSDPAKVKIAVYEMDFVQDMLKFIYSSEKKKHELGLWWNVVSKLLPYADAEIAEMESKVSVEFNEPKSREETCVDTVGSTLGMAASYYYTTAPKYNETKVAVREMVDNMKESFAELIEQSPWMDKETKEKSLLKIKNMKSQVAYPNVIINTPILNEFYKYVEIKDNLLETLLLKVQRYTKNQLSKYNQPNDPNEDRWIITPNMVNAFYEPTTNTITIPAGILGAPVYFNGLKALDYGAVGSIVGHEITHGFDNSGRRYNSVGNIEDWWKPETLAEYKKKAKCFIEAYDTYDIDFNDITQKVDSKASFGENVADNGGFKEALMAYRKYVSKNGPEPLLTQHEYYTHEQLFTLGFANVWCENPTILEELLAEYMDHSPNGVRVNGVLKNSEEFSRIWNCTKGSNMNPIEKCSLW